MKNKAKIAIVVYRNNAGADQLETFIKFHKENLADFVLYSDQFPIPIRFQSDNKKPLIVKQLIFIYRYVLLYLRLKIASIDLVVAEFGTIGADTHYFLKSIKMPLVVEFRGFDASIKRILDEYKEKYLSLFKYVAFCVVKSKKMKEALMDMGCNEEKLRIIPSGFNAKAFTRNVFSTDSRNFVFVGRLVEVKGPTFAIQAFSEVLQQFPESRLIIVGDGPLYEECVKTAERLGVINSIDFVGSISQEQIIEYFSSSITLINHSITASNGAYEGFPSVILEANASGLPVIATSSGGIVEAVVDGENGFLVDEKDYMKQADYMRQLLENPDEAKKMGEKGRSVVCENLTNESSLKKLQNEISNVLKTNSK